MAKIEREWQAEHEGAALATEVHRILVVSHRQAKGFTEQEIKDAKAAWLQGQASSRAQDRELASRLASNLYLGRTMAWQADLEHKVQALTNDQILAALHKHFDPSKISVFVAGDFTKADKK